MARIRPAKGQSETGVGKGVSPPSTPAPSRRRPAPPGERRSTRVRPQQQRPKVEKSGSVTKAVQVNRASRFFQEVVVELRKVSWPDRKQLLQSTAVVLVCVAVVATYLGVLDFIFRRVVDVIF
jgi:preprotein translocase subunit SecE